MTDDQRERRATALGDEGGPHHVNDAQRWKHTMAADDALPRTVASLALKVLALLHYHYSNLFPFLGSFIALPFYSRFRSASACFFLVI
jgi:hypothetical protein